MPYTSLLMMVYLCDGIKANVVAKVQICFVYTHLMLCMQFGSYLIRTKIIVSISFT